MSDAFYIGSIGLTSQQTALDVMANNIANINTQGFKRSDVRFADMLMSGMSALGGAPSGAGLRADSKVMMDEQGDLKQTGRTFDIAIEGGGFIELMGPNGQSYLWRGGQLQIDERGMLSADNGMALFNRISVPLDATGLRIQNDGMVMAATDEGEIDIGQITLSVIESDIGLERLDGGLYKPGDETRVRDAIPGEDGAGLLVQGALEQSNVNLNIEMVQMLLTQRAYSANAQIVQAADQLMAIANNLRQ